MLYAITIFLDVHDIKVEGKCTHTHTHYSIFSQKIKISQLPIGL